MIRYSFLLVDLDGTAAYTWPHALAEFKIISEEVGIGLNQEALWNFSANGGTFTDCCKVLFPHISKHTVLSILNSNPRITETCSLTEVVPGIPELFRDCRNIYGAKIAIVTNRQYHPGFDDILLQAELIIGDTIDVIVSYSDDLRPKPYPDLFYRAMTELGMRKGKKALSKCLIIEDGLHGLCSLEGVDTCAVLWGFGSKRQLLKAEPNYFVNNSDELRRVIFGEVC